MVVPGAADNSPRRRHHPHDSGHRGIRGLTCRGASPRRWWRWCPRAGGTPATRTKRCYTTHPCRGSSSCSSRRLRRTRRPPPREVHAPPSSAPTPGAGRTREGLERRGVSHGRRLGHHGQGRRESRRQRPSLTPGRDLRPPTAPAGPLDTGRRHVGAGTTAPVVVQVVALEHSSTWTDPRSPGGRNRSGPCGGLGLKEDAPGRGGRLRHWRLGTTGSETHGKLATRAP